MKKTIMLLVLVLPLAIMAQSQVVKISGSIKNITDTIDKVYLSYVLNDKRVSDSATVVNGKYSFEINANEVLRVQFLARNSNNKAKKITRRDVANAFLEPGNIFLENVDSFSNVKVSGSKANDEMKKLDEKSKPYTQELEKLSTAFSAALKEKNTVESKKLETQIDDLEAKMNAEIYGAYAKSNPASPVALIALQRFAGYDINADVIDPVFNALPVAVQNSSAGKSFKSKIEIAKKTGIGQYAIDFTQNDTLGNPVKLSSLRGKYLLVDFWASWCGPCRRENPNVVAAFNKYKDKGFHILSVSLDQPGAKDKWIKAIHDDGLTWTHVSDLQYWNNAVAKEYGIQSIPQNLLLDPQGKIIAKNLRGEDLNEKLRSILN